MKPFDIEKAKAGAKVVTRDGREARILAFDFVGGDGQPIIAAIRDGATETISQHKTNGAFYAMARESNQDLMMAPVKVVKWVRIYRVHDKPSVREARCQLFDTKEQAEADGVGSNQSVAVAPIEWEE